jgi:hypothetical protein
MHPALHIHEIADAVVSLSQRPDLASLARTCRWLSEPALDVLWESPQPWDLALRMRPELWAVTSDLDDDEEEDWSEYGGDKPFCGMLVSSSSCDANTTSRKEITEPLTFCERHRTSRARPWRPIRILCQTCTSYDPG